MPTKRHTSEQIVHKLREAEVELAKGSSVKEVAKKLGITDQTYYRYADSQPRYRSRVDLGGRGGEAVKP